MIVIPSVKNHGQLEQEHIGDATIEASSTNCRHDNDNDDDLDDGGSETPRFETSASQKTMVSRGSSKLSRHEARKIVKKDQRKRKAERVPKYLREDFPKNSVAIKQESLLEKYNLGLKTQNLLKFMVLSKKKKKRKGKGKNNKKKTQKTTETTKPEFVPKPPREDRSSIHIITPRKLNIPEVRIPPGKFVAPKALDPAIENKIAQSLNTTTSATLPTSCLTHAARRINERLSSLQAPKARKEFMTNVEIMENQAREKAQDELRKLRSEGKSKILENQQSVRRSGFTIEQQQRRELLARKLDEQLRQAHERKQRLEQERKAKIDRLLQRIKAESPPSQAALRIMEQQRKSKARWEEVIMLSIHAERMGELINSLQLRKFFRAKAIVIQRNVRMMIAIRVAKKARLAKARMNGFCFTVVKARQPRRNHIAAKLILQFLVDNRLNFAQIMHSFRGRVLKCQRLAKSFLKCTKARQLALSKIWAQQERRIMNETKRLRIKILEAETRRLQAESEEMLGKSIFHQKMAHRMTRGVPVPKLNHDVLKHIPTTKEGKIHFPAGMKSRTNHQVLDKHEEQVEQEATMQRDDGVIGQADRQRFEKVQYIMDTYLNEEFQLKVEREKEKPLVIPYIGKNLRNVALSDIISRARQDHLDRIKEMQKEQKVLETQKVKVNVKEAHRLLHHDKESIGQTIQKISSGSKPIVLLYSTLSREEIFKMVKKTQFRMTRRPSLKRIIRQVQFKDAE